ncbi:MAG: TIR domain-containing protein, partial [Acutalibacteraceae bacterium]
EQDNGERTLDSFRARSLYEKLTAKGIRTFYAPESLPLGKNYEPIIFSALHTSRVMVLMGSKPEYFTAPWVKNEWARYLELINNGEEKTLIPAYWDLLPDMDLPRELSSLQAVNMGTPVGELQLIEYVQKLVNAKNGKTTQPAAAAAAVSAGSVMQQEARSLLKRADIFLDNGQISDAATYYNRVLDKDPENAQAYWGQLLCKLKCRTADEMIRKGQQISGEIAYKNAIRFASPDLKKAYQAVNAAIDEWIQLVCRMLDQALSRQLRDENFLQKAGAIEENMKKRAPEVQNIGQSMQQKLTAMQQQMQKVTAQSQTLRTQMNNLQNQYNLSVNQFNQQKEIPVAYNMLGTLQQQRKALDDALSAYLTYCQNSQDASTLRTIFSQCRLTQSEMDKMIQFYQQQEGELQTLEQQVNRLKNQCEKLKNEVRSGQYSNAWAFIGHEVQNPVTVRV